MRDYIITVNSTVDTGKEWLEERNVPVIPLKYTIDGQEYTDMYGLSDKEFFQKLREGKMSVTSQINPEEAKEMLEPYVKEGKDVLHLAFSSALSGTCNSMKIAAEELQEEYPEAKVIVVDTLCACMGEAMLLYYALKQKEAGKTIEEVAQWTVTGSGAFLIGNKKSNVKITGLTIGKIVDYGLKDSQNMGACMAPAAADTIAVNLKDMGRSPEDYDRIITGDLGYVGQSILLDLMRKRKIDLTQNHMDCGMTIFNQQTQDTHSGGSGCGCAATTLAAYILPKLRTGEWKRVLFVPTGALMSTVSYNEGESVPGIAHGIVLEHEPSGKKQEVE